MPIQLLTGRPGHGKTSEMMAMLLAKAKEGGRPIYAAGIDGLTPGIAQPLEDPTKWQECEDGSLIFVDEAWRWFGHLHSAVGKPTPPHVLALAEHRHRGFDFIWTAQGPGQIYPFVRTLIEQHWHFVRRWGTQVVDIYKWDDLADDVKGKTSRELAQHTTTKINKAGWGAYTSATGHTIKSRIPWKVWLVPVTAIAGAVLLWVAYQNLKPDAMAAGLTGKGAGGSLLPADPTSQPVAADPSLSFREAAAAQWLEPMVMRIPGLHGSQPIFDGREAQSIPRTFCVISGEPGADRCRCYTEQVTRILDVREDTCRYTALHGQYDPFLPPPQVGSPGEAPPEEEAAIATGGPAGARTDPGQVGSPDQGEVWGKKPETLRTSNIGG